MLLSLMTDYGLNDGFVAACHGAVLARAPRARILDITHLIPPQDVRRGAAVLAQTLPDLPVGVHMSVIDPGVGTSRRAVTVEVARGDLLVGPDNGVLAWAADALGGPLVAVQLLDRQDHAGAVTFDGRDVFAPAAALLLSGTPIAQLGPALAVTDLRRLREPVVRVTDNGLETEVLTVDRFGNIQLAARRADAAGLAAGAELHVTLPSTTISLTFARTFADVPIGAPVLFVDSAGHLALAIRDGNAADHFAAGPSDTVQLRLKVP